MVINLLQNALKFSKANDYVTVRLKLIDTCEPTDVELQIEVIDQGIGIPEADLPNIFKPYFKSTDSTVINKNSYGNGLGLSICQRIMSQLNGRIKVKSKQGNGSTFKVKLKTQKVKNNVSWVSFNTLDIL